MSSRLLTNSGSSLPIIALVQSNTLARSSMGMPIISAIACRGNSAEIARTKSQRPFSTTWSRMMSARFWR